jgi:flavin reductase (DIM6/NTAB) family NADH-FMN oxidoreductase RutF
MHLNRDDINQADRIFRLNLINSLSGIKPANLIGTRSAQGQENLAIISSVVHLGSDPALLGFFSRPTGEVRRHTLENLQETGTYTVNHLLYTRTEQGHWTSAKFGPEESEFEFCGFEPEYLPDFPAPFVAESAVKLGLQFRELHPIALNGTALVIGEIVHILIEEDLVSPQGYLNLEAAGSAGISGLNSYYAFRHLADHPYARREELPEGLNKP